MIRKIYLPIVVRLLVMGCFAGDSRYQEDMQRKQLFDNQWKFHPGDISAAYKVDFNDHVWRKLDLPHDWSIEGQIDPSNPSGNDGGYFPTGTGWYRKTFSIPSFWQDKRVSIYFEGVYMNSEVFINGNSLGIHPYGYSSFVYDLTPYLNIGKENVIAVRVDNSKQKNCRWYSGSGIYRHVWLLVTEPLHIDHWGVAITTPQASVQKATVQIQILVKNETSSPQSFILSTQLTDVNSRSAGNNKVTVEIEANNEKEIEQTIHVTDPLLWTMETPHLYQAQTKVIQDNSLVDITNHTFGIRSIEFSAENGFRLNGRPVIINGGCVHHDNGCLGAAAYDRAEERKAELLKAAGFNAVRTAHNPPSETFLEACDRSGLLVIDESFDGWRVQKTEYDYAMYFDKWWQRDIESMVLRDRNHPSIIMWSIGNEIIERTKHEAVETAHMLADAVREIDPTRPVTSAMTTWDQGWQVFDSLMAVHDVCGYNYQLHRAPDDHERMPFRIIVNTESYPANAFKIHDLVQQHSYIIGDFVWTAMDYLGESGIGGYYYPGEQADEHWQSDRYPWHGAYCGDIDLTGWRKPISHYRSMLYNNNEKIYMAVREPNPENGTIKLTGWSVWPTWESWTWPGFEDDDMQVEIYSKYPRVRLYLNGILMGEQLTTKKQEFKATFTVPYTPGILKAAGVEDGEEMETTILQTAGQDSRIKLTPDRIEISANGQDLCFVTVEITDKDGIVHFNADNRFWFEIDGPGKIIGVENADMRDTDPYVGNTRKAWHGRAMIVIKSTRKEGEISLKVKSPGLKSGSLRIMAKKLRKHI